MLSEQDVGSHQMGDAHVERLPNQSANRAATPFPAVEPLHKIKLTVALAQLPAAVLTPDFAVILAVTHMPQLKEALSHLLVK